MTKVLLTEWIKYYIMTQIGAITATVEAVGGGAWVYDYWRLYCI